MKGKRKSAASDETAPPKKQKATGEPTGECSHKISHARQCFFSHSPPSCCQPCVLMPLPAAYANVVGHNSSAYVNVL